MALFANRCSTAPFFFPHSVGAFEFPLSVLFAVCVRGPGVAKRPPDGCLRRRGAPHLVRGGLKDPAA